MTGQLLTAFKQRIRELRLIPSDGGRFELSVNGELLYSKLKTGTFPDERWVIETVESRLKR